MISQSKDLYDALVVGGGQAALAMGHSLRAAGLSFRILDGESSSGASWRRRWDSLTLFTPRRYSALPGLEMDGDPDGYAGKDEVADYLAGYARHLDLPIIHDAWVVALHQDEDGTYVARTSAGDEYRAPHVVVATGPFQTPWTPPIAAELGGVFQLHSADYTRPEALPSGPVLVVGGGNSGVQIADELARTRPVTLSIGARMPRLPERVLGRSVFWWLEAAGLMSVSRSSLLGRRMSRTETLIGTSPRMLKRRGVEVVGRITDGRDGLLTTADGAQLQPKVVVWATGYRPDYDWLNVPGVLSADSRPIHDRGMTGARGLYFLGLSWLYTRGSALIGWVGRDAEHLARQITSRPGSVPRHLLATLPDS